MLVALSGDGRSRETAEVPHRSAGEGALVMLLRDIDGAQILEHSVTGEAVALPMLGDSACWQLHFSDRGWAAIVPSVPQPHVAPMWATSLFRLSLWASRGTFWVQKLWSQWPC